MRKSWAQPSLSRDFALLSAAILFILFFISALVTYSTYSKHVERVTAELEKEAARMESSLDLQMENADYMLTALGRQIVIAPNRDLLRLAEMLKPFDSRDYIYSIFSWVGPDQTVLVSSNKGVLEAPVDISDRDYVKKAFSDPWKMTIGRPIEGRVSGHWVIPVAMGLTDYSGKFIGTIMISIDINHLTTQLTRLIKRDGISFAILSKTLIPLTQVSDDKDFVAHNFPTQKLASVNFSRNPTGLISQGNLFWNGGDYAYYRVSPDYPYIMLLGYDAHYSDESMRGILWARLFQIVGLATFLVLFLWIGRARLIKPVIELTDITASVARGEPFRPLSDGGPVEIEGLSQQINRVADYIAENKRLEEELRNKMLMLRKAKERCDTDRRNASEFLAYICQEMRAPLTNIIGFAQVMKDQLYGPIENRKYKQYANDIYSTGNSLLAGTQDMLTLAKVETDYIELAEKPVDVAATINRSLRFLADRLQADKLAVKVQLQEPLPRLIADEFRLQQIVMNLLLYALGHMLPESTVGMEARVVHENKDKLFFALIINSYERPALTQAELLAIAERSQPVSPRDDSTPSANLSLELARALITLHGAHIDVNQVGEGKLTITVLFGGNRIRFTDA